jgi:hypothetical protein
MADPVTANKFLAQPVPGTDVGTWGPPINTNTGIIDASLGGTATIALNNSNVVLSSGQYQNTFLTFISTLTGSVTITFPPVGSFYTVQNLCTGIGTFTVTLATTVAGGQVIGCPPGEAVDIMTDGTNVKFRNLDRIGSYMDYYGTSVPNWINACSVPPYLYCNGQAFSSVTYPVLAVILGGTVTPDMRGRFRASFNDGTGRITTQPGVSGGGIDGNTPAAGGGQPSNTIAVGNIPSYNLTVVDGGHSHTPLAGNNFAVGVSGGPLGFLAGSGSVLISEVGTTNTATTGITVASAGSGVGISNLPPGVIGGITLIRAG